MKPRSKIAILGSAPSSVDLAPFQDLTWDIWACSPATVDHLKRCNTFFELHPFDPGASNMGHDYVKWMSLQGCPIYMQRKQPEIPTSLAFPFDELVAEYGPYFFTSSIAWMMALALRHDIEELGLWGIDMAAVSEYAEQRPGCHYFIQRARDKGIKITTPPESDILRPPRPYGISFGRPADVKLRVRMGELQNELAMETKKAEDALRAVNFLNGCIEDMKYHMRVEAE